MLFNSLIFFVFALLFYVFWPAARPYPQVRFAYIVLFSLIFYGWVTPWFILLLLFTGGVDFAAGLAMARYPSWAKWILVGSIISNVGVLGIFKYSTFVVENLNALGTSFALPFAIVLPVGLSFYTFQSMNYTISVYRKDIQPTRNPLHFFSFISLFPHLVAGPLVRASDILPQLQEVGSTTEEQKWDGLGLIIRGYFKKCVFADNLAFMVNRAFSAEAPMENAYYWWIVTSFFAVQIYCDFSGYTDIARGLAKWMGIEFGVNFNHPYIATSIRDFWQRWHISLSTWFRDYVYIPLGGARGSSWLGMRNMWLTMCISGVWHGASWNFLIWGAIHSACLTLERLTRWPEKIRLLPLGRPLCTALVLIQVWYAWVFFRARDFAQAAQITTIMSIPNFHLGALKSALGAVDPLSVKLTLLLFLWEGWFFFGFDRKRTLQALEPLALVCMALAAIFVRGRGGAFIYFQF